MLKRVSEACFKECKLLEGLTCIEMHVVGFLEIQHQANQMHGQLKHMSRLMKVTIAKGISN